MLSSVCSEMRPCAVVVVLFAVFGIGAVVGRLQPAENVFPTDVSKALLPNVRQSLNDCHLRYHKYGDYNLIYPIFGVPARIGEFAHMAAIGWSGAGGAVDFNCGGSLITASHVLTSAHCAARDGTPPDVVRLGAININMSIDDPRNNYAQQYRIASFKRHPEHRFSAYYNDIAIITLDRKVAINDVVTPACLWTQNEVDFPRLEAVGFGQTSFAGDKTPILLKVKLSPIDNAECGLTHTSAIRQLRQGIIDSQMCAKDSKMDTCLGDSGGPLQAKLMSNHRTTPYVVGITSFGMFCGTEAPSVYTRVSSYISWIESETNETFASVECAARHIHLREADESMVTTRAGDHVFIEPEKSYMDIEIMAKHRVYLGYERKQDNLIQWNCGGVLINEDYVLTVAHCDKFVFDQTPSHVKVGDLDIFGNSPEAQIIAIEQIIKHPNYREGFMENDIALVKLAKDVKIGPNTLPACVVNNDLTMAMYEMNGLGPYNLNNFLRTDESISRNNSLVLTRMRVDPTPCERGHSNQIMCAKNSKFLVPQTCRIEHGGPLERETWHYDRYFQYVFGLTVAGKDCGFGSEAYFVRTSAHSAWIESIVLQKQQRQTAQRRRQRRQIFFPDQEYGVPVRVGQPCVTSGNAPGICEHYRNCPSINNSATLLVKFCRLGVDPMVCCERSSAIRSGYSLKKCVAHWKQFKRPEEEEYEGIPSEGRPVQVEEFPHIVFIGVRRNNQVYWRCTGVLVSDEFVLSSGSCVKSGMIDVVRLGAIQLDGGNSIETGEIINIAQILTHPEYDSTTFRADLALIKLSSRVTFNSRVLPACLWPNQDSVPLKLYSLGVDDGSISVRPRLSKYNQDCRKFFQLRNLADDEQLCAENYFTTSDSCLDRNGDPIEGTLANGNIKISIVVGLTAYSMGCPGAPEPVTVYTRLSAYMEWIRSIVES